MKISTRGRYAIRLMLDLAVYYNGGPVSLKDIAKRQNVSDKYLEQIISALHKAGQKHPGLAWRILSQFSAMQIYGGTDSQGSRGKYVTHGLRGGTGS